MALGNIVGSGFINITLILGVALSLSPLTVNIAAFSNLAVFSLIANLFLWYFLGSERISWREGVLLLALYAMFLATSFGGGSIQPVAIEAENEPADDLREAQGQRDRAQDQQPGDDARYDLEQSAGARNLPPGLFPLDEPGRNLPEG